MEAPPRSLPFSISKYLPVSPPANPKNDFCVLTHVDEATIFVSVLTAAERRLLRTTRAGVGSVSHSESGVLSQPQKICSELEAL